MLTNLYIFIRTLVLVPLLKHGIRKHASSAMACPVSYDRTCTVIESLRLPAVKEQEVKAYLWTEMRKYY
jgi:hypothetical protein